MKVKLSSPEVEKLLSDVCAELGLCLPISAIRRISNSPPNSADKLTVVIYMAEGLDPMLGSDRYKAVLAKVERAFREHRK